MCKKNCESDEARSHNPYITDPAYDHCAITVHIDCKQHLKYKHTQLLNIGLRILAKTCRTLMIVCTDHIISMHLTGQ